MNSVKIPKIYKTESSVPLEPEVDLDFRGHLNKDNRNLRHVSGILMRALR